MSQPVPCHSAPYTNHLPVIGCRPACSLLNLFCTTAALLPPTSPATHCSLSPFPSLVCANRAHLAHHTMAPVFRNRCPLLPARTQRPGAFPVGICASSCALPHPTRRLGCIIQSGSRVQASTNPPSSRSSSRRPSFPASSSPLDSSTMDAGTLLLSVSAAP